MQRWIIGLAASAATLSVWSGNVTAAPLTVTYQGYILDSNFQTTDPFTAVFNFDTTDLLVDSGDNTLFNSINNNPTASFSSLGLNLSFDSDAFFDTRVSSGFAPLYQFEIEGNGGYLYLKFTGGVEEGLYQLPNGASVTLEPTSVLITPGEVSTVPLPPAVFLFGSALLMLGAARAAHKRIARMSSNVHPRASAPSAA